MQGKKAGGKQEKAERMQKEKAGKKPYSLSLQTQE